MNEEYSVDLEFVWDIADRAVTARIIRETDTAT